MRHFRNDAPSRYHLAKGRSEAVGYLYAEQAVCPVTGQFVGKLQCETLACAHCRAVIAVVTRGTRKVFQSEHRCTRCDAPICRYCATQRAGQCEPFAQRIEQLLREREKRPWRYTSGP